MTKKSKDLDDGLAAEKSPARIVIPAEKLEKLEVAALDAELSLEVLESEAVEMLVALEKRCMDGGTANLDDIRAVLAKLRG